MKEPEGNFKATIKLSPGFESVVCQICMTPANWIQLEIGGKDSSVNSYGHIYGDMRSAWAVCGNCGAVCQNPRPSLKTLDDYYNSGSYHSFHNKEVQLEEDPELLIFRRRKHYAPEMKWLLNKRESDSPGRVLDIGCGYGASLHSFKALGWEVFGIEPDPHHCEYAIKCGLKKSEIFNGLFDASSDFGQFDLVFSHHAFEHFADLNSVMRGLENSVKEGGHIFTSIPTYFKNKTKRVFEWLGAAHYTIFDDVTFNYLLGRYGFREIAHRYPISSKYCDQLWHLARFNRKPIEVQGADPKRVKNYIDSEVRKRSNRYAVYYGDSKFSRLIRKIVNRICGKFGFMDPPR